jgi:hypothetical protein
MRIGTMNRRAVLLGAPGFRTEMTRWAEVVEAADIKIE